MKRATTIAFLAAMLAPAAVLAQGATAVPLDKATVSKEVAQRTLMKTQKNWLSRRPGVPARNARPTTASDTATIAQRWFMDHTSMR